MVSLRVLRNILTSIFIAAVFISALAGLAQPAHAKMTHDTLEQKCLSGCAGNNFYQQSIIFSQTYEQDQNKPPSELPQPYYRLFASFYTQKPTLHTHAPRTLRPPDLVKLYANYRN